MDRTEQDGMAGPPPRESADGGVGGSTNAAPPREEVEARAADTLLQTPFTITLAGRSFSVAPPTVATLMRLSAEVGQLPQMAAGGEAPTQEQILQHVIAHAEGCTAAGRAVAVLLLGARGYGRKPWWRRRTDGARLGDWLLRHVSPRELLNAFGQLVWRMQVVDFFAFTAFLHEANLLRGKAETQMTAPGRSSRGQ